jgi:hypothetical protein
MAAMNGSTISGPGFTARVPQGFTVVPPHPMAAYQMQMAAMFGMPVPLQSYLLVPPGSNPPPLSPALVILEELHPQAVPMFMQNLYGLEHPFVAMMNAASLGIQQIIATAPARQVPLPSGAAHIREFDGLSMPPMNQPIRFMVFAIQGMHSTVKVVIGINLYRWVEFIGPCLELVGGINLSGGQPIETKVLAVVDKNRDDQIEMNIVHPDNTRVPVSAFPTVVYGNVVVNVHDSSTHVGGYIQGTGIAVGQHSLSRLN